MSAATTNQNARRAEEYLRTKVLTASPEELRLMLLDGAIKFARQAQDGLARRDYEASFAGITQCRNIVFELLTTIRDEHDPDLAEKARAVYAFMYRELIDAGPRRPDALDKVLNLLEFERETWVLLMQKLADEKAAGKQAGSPGASVSVHG